MISQAQKKKTQLAQHKYAAKQKTKTKFFTCSQ